MQHSKQTITESPKSNPHHSEGCIAVSQGRKMPMSIYLVMLLAIIHLTLVTLAAADVDIGHFTQSVNWLRFYEEASAANAQYNFFAPGIEYQIRVHFLIGTPNGKTQLVKLETGQSKEADLRIGNIFDQFLEYASTNDDNDGDVETDPSSLNEKAKVRKSLAASLAASLFARYPNATSVTVQIEKFVPLSLPEVRVNPNARAEWTNIYSIQFTQNKRVELQ